jgi:hypothetical protein
MFSNARSGDVEIGGERWLPLTEVLVTLLIDVVFEMLIRRILNHQKH